MIQVELRLFGDLRKYHDTPLDTGHNMPLKQRTSILDLINQLKIPVDETKIILVNGRHKELHYLLTDGDRLSIFPAVAGG
jgi:molybdopterin synthase sulfur carrier subunit